MSRYVQGWSFIAAVALSQAPAFQNALAQDIAQDAAPAAAPPAAEAAAPQFRPVSDEQFQTARQQLEQAIARLNRYLGTNANAQAWREYLRLEELQGQLAADAEVDPSVLRQSWLRFNSQRYGLHLPAFEAVRKALKGYRGAALVHGNPESEAETAAALAELEEIQQAHAENPTLDTQFALGETLGWLDLRGQAPQRVAQVRGQYARPNMYTHLSERLVDVGLARNVNRVEPVNDIILGTYVSGTSHTVGRVRAHLVPNPHRAVIDSIFSGTSYSRTVGRNGTATIHSAGTTYLHGRKRLYFEATGLKTVPATATADTNTRTLGVDSGRGGILIGHIADRIAANRVAQNKARSEQISSERAANRLRNRIDRDSNPELAEANLNYWQDFRWPLLEEGAFPSRLSFSTTQDHVLGVGVQADAGQIAASTPPPGHVAASDLGLRLHETALANLAQSSLAGDRVTQDDFEKWALDTFGRVPEQFERKPGSTAWAITFDDQRPLGVTIGTNEVRIVLRVGRVEGSANSRRRWDISATYKLYKTPGGMLAVRQGPVEVVPPGFKEGDRLPGSAIAERTNVQQQFEEDLFQDRIEHTGLTLTGEWGEKVGKMPLIELASQAGWIVLAWIKP